MVYGVVTKKKTNPSSLSPMVIGGSKVLVESVLFFFFYCCFHCSTVNFLGGLVTKKKDGIQGGDDDSVHPTKGKTERLEFKGT